MNILHGDPHSKVCVDKLNRSTPVSATLKKGIEQLVRFDFALFVEHGHDGSLPGPDSFVQAVIPFEQLVHLWLSEYVKFQELFFQFGHFVLSPNENQHQRSSTISTDC